MEENMERDEMLLQIDASPQKRRIAVSTSDDKKIGKASSDHHADLLKILCRSC